MGAFLKVLENVGFFSHNSGWDIAWLIFFFSFFSAIFFCLLDLVHYWDHQFSLHQYVIQFDNATVYSFSKKFLRWILLGWFQVFCKNLARDIFWDIFHHFCFMTVLTGCCRTFSFVDIDFSSRNVTSFSLSWFCK